MMRLISVLAVLVLASNASAQCVVCVPAAPVIVQAPMVAVPPVVVAPAFVPVVPAVPVVPGVAVFHRRHYWTPVRDIFFGRWRGTFIPTVPVAPVVVSPSQTAASR